MGRLDAVDVGSKKLTVQTEFFPNPNWRIETKVYLGGALKKVYTEDLSGRPESELQRVVNEFHQTKLDEIVAGPAENVAMTQRGPVVQSSSMRLIPKKTKNTGAASSRRRTGSSARCAKRHAAGIRRRKNREAQMHFGYYLQPLHLNADDREDLPRKLLFVLARRKPPLDFLELSGAGIRIPHAFPKGFSLEKVLRIALQEIKRIPLRDPTLE